MDKQPVNSRQQTDVAESYSAATLEPDLVERLFAGCITDRHDAGHVLFLQDDLSDELHLLVSGTVEISIYSASGRKLVANIVTAGSLVGEIGALDGGIRTATATCFSNCEVKTLSRAKLLRRVEDDGELASALINLLCARLRWISAELGDQAHLKIDQRLAKRLTLLDELMADRNGWIAIPQAELAEYLGATRESINKILTAWRREGILESKRGSIRILKPDRLLQLSRDRDT